ncbi:glycogen synthase GlgA [Sphingomonas nostoxanthinifaciens]|uniref:glycogen synthase GlgA n=1 Tax=Sphingomonas nostoxanthinifaciens TaxID=2872652 RepID=UPI001CC1DBC9|nr:glycogen synthase GlgA [Sphingomonas nostoxanthinifaciens]UAK23306.1 glycogen synthase GlgA [Sphingomonas nostoxanthinifaciens]
MPLSLLSVTPEVYPLVKTGGLADVAGALPAALAAEDVAVTTFVPGYPAVLGAIGDAAVVHAYDALMGGPATLRRATVAGLDLLVLDAPHLFARDGNPYLGPDGRDWPDNPLRFGAFARAAADVASGLLPDLLPDVVQLHDWQAALTAVYLHYDPPTRRPGVVMTIHNLAFQGIFPAYLLGALGLPAEAFALDALEYYGSIGFLKGGLIFADRITTVSPTYATEITTPEGGMGLGGLLAGRGQVLSGILNGIDTDVWDPAADPRIAARYSAADLGGRAADKSTLQRAFALPEAPEAFVIGSVGRMTEQKGMDLLLALLPELGEVQIVLLGSGDAGMEAAFVAAAAASPDRVACRIGYDEALSHQIQAGSDAFLMPSRFEPCGLTQMYALRYGAVPIVARVGGLADTVIDASPYALAQGVATGFQFAPGSVPAMRAAIRRAAELYRDDEAAWAQLQQNGMATDCSWNSAAKQYAALFRSIRA